MSSPPNAADPPPPSDAPPASIENDDNGDNEKGNSDCISGGESGELRWNSDVSLALHRIRRSLSKSTAPCNEVIISSGEKVCANCQAGYASYDASRGVWEVRYRPIPQTLTPSLSPCLMDHACPSDAGARLVAELKSDESLDARTEVHPLPPVEAVMAVLKQMELRELLYASRNSSQTSQSVDLHKISVTHLRQGETVSLAPIFESCCPSGANFIPINLSECLELKEPERSGKWTATFLHQQQHANNDPDTNADMPDLRAFILDCLASYADIATSRDNTDDNSTSIVSVETLHQNPLRQSDGFASVNSLLDISSHTADTNIATDEDSRLTDDAPKTSLPAASDTVVKQPPGKKRKVLRPKELDNLQKDEGRVAAPDRKIVQLFASDFASSRVDVSSQGRPKRKIKHVVRFDAAPHSYSLERKKTAAAGKIGSGFLCPSCSFHCSYDARECLNCKLPCRYVAGTGVVVERERDEVAKGPSPDIKGDMNFLDVSNRRFKGSKKSVATASEEDDQNKSKKKHESSVNASVEANASTLLSSSTVPLDASASNPQSSTNRTARKRNGIESMECGVCEVCFRIFSASYLQTHRKRSHNISPDMFGCPYCSQCLISAQNRELHIQRKHPGKISNLSEEEIARTKILPYLCPLCSSPPYTLFALRTHLRGHNVQFNDVHHLIRCICPFCPLDGNNEHVTFETADQLDEHVKNYHEGCNLIGMRLKRRAPLGTKKSGKEPVKKAEAPSVVEAVMASDSSQESTTSTEEESWWAPLSHHGLIAQVQELDKDICISTPIDSAILTIASRLDKVQKLASRSKKSDDDDRNEKDYLAENRLYLRGVRERQRKADSERLEKEKYKEKVEERLMLWRYQNRGKPKKTKAEKEEHALITRPIRFEQRKSQRLTGDNICRVGDDCPLCNGEYAKPIITDDEMKKANFDISKVIPLPLNEDSKKIMSPSYRELPRGYEYESEDEPADTNGHEQEHNLTAREKNLTRSAQRWKKASSEVHLLSEAKNSLEFIKRYNNGLLERTRLKRGDR